jgi:hypothetical protein
MAIINQARDQYNYTADCTSNFELVTCEKIRLVGAIFNGSTFDTNFWTKGTLVNGTVSQTGSEVVVTSGAANLDYASFYSVRRANWITGTSNKFRTQMRLEAAADSDLTRRWGIGYAATMTSTAITDGACFKLTGTALSIVTHSNSTAGTAVASGDFNGTYTAPTWTNNNTFEILYTLGKAYFLINNVIIHTVSATTTHWTSNTTSFHCFADATTSGDGSTAKTMTFRMMNITRLGAITTNPQFFHGTTAADTILKYGGGKLHSIVLNNPGGTLISIYDNTSGTGNAIAIINTPSTADPCTLDYHLPFQNGLHIVSTGTWDFTLIYE